MDTLLLPLSVRVAMDFSRQNLKKFYSFPLKPIVGSKDLLFSGLKHPLPMIGRVAAADNILLR